MADATVAREIMRQMGGNKLVAMVGVKDLMGHATGLQFGFKAKARNKANKVLVHLEKDDTYSMEFWSIRGHDLEDMQRVGDFRDLHAEDLCRVFEDATGLAVSL